MYPEKEWVVWLQDTCPRGAVYIWFCLLALECSKQGEGLNEWAAFAGSAEVLALDIFYHHNRKAAFAEGSRRTGPSGITEIELTGPRLQN
jgi:hypothetical protein